MHIYIYIFLNFMCIYIFFKYKLFKSYNDLCMCVFRADRLALDKQLECSSLEKATSSVPRFPCLSVAPCVGLRLHGLFSIQFGIFIDVIIVISQWTQAARWRQGWEGVGNGKASFLQPMPLYYRGGVRPDLPSSSSQGLFTHQ